MDTNVQIITVVVAAVLLALMGAGVALFRANVSREKVKALLEKYSPDDIKAIVVWAGLKAYDAVEQVASAYEGLSSEEKQALAAKYAEALIKLVLFGKTSELASNALLESQIRADKHPEMALAPLDAPMREVNIGGAVK